MNNPKQEQILKAINAIDSKSHEFCCCALGWPGDPVRKEFESIFSPEWSAQLGDTWTFFSDSFGNDIIPMPSEQEQINIRLTALWFFYHMQ